MKNKTTKKQKIRTVLVGVAASPGYAYGPVRKTESRKFTLDPSALPSSTLAAEEKRFRKAVETTAKEIEDLKKVAIERLGEDEARIFDSHLMMLKDSMLIDPIVESILKGAHNARWAVHSSLSFRRPRSAAWHSACAITGSFATFSTWPSAVPLVSPKPAISQVVPAGTM